MRASWWRRSWQPLKMLLSRAVGTRMVGGFVRGDGEYLPHTRISNTSAVFAREHLQVGDHVFIGHFSVLDASYGLTIGEGCQIGFFTGIFSHSSHAAIRLYGREYVNTAEKKAYFTAPVEIGPYSFIGAHATLLPGTRLGRGSIVSAYSMVSGEHPNFAILAGQPAEVVGDTRKMDEKLLGEHPELRTHYEAWAQVKLVLIGDGESPHLAKWARALAPRVELWAASSRRCAPELEALIPADRRYVMDTATRHGGGNWAVLKGLPALARWLQKVDADWLHAHYLTSHGTLAWVAKSSWGLRARIAGSAWGSDILVTPGKNAAYRWLTRRVLAACEVTTSDSQHMAACMRELGAGEVMVFPFGLETMPPANEKMEPWLCFTNRGLEPIYRPERVIEAFATLQPEAQLVVANDGSLRGALEDQVRSLGLAERVRFVGRLDAKTQAGYYTRASWYFSLPESDSVSVSVLEAMAHGCVPVLSDLPANRELIGPGAGQGLIVEAAGDWSTRMAALDLSTAARTNRAWVVANGLFAPAVERFLERLSS